MVPTSIAKLSCRTPPRLPAGTRPESGSERSIVVTSTPPAPLPQSSLFFLLHAIEQVSRERFQIVNCHSIIRSCLEERDLCPLKIRFGFDHVEVVGHVVIEL